MLNHDVLLYILLFLDIQTVYSIRCINNKFNYMSNLIFNKYSFICGFLCNDRFSNKITILVNPSIRNLKLLVKYTCKKKTLFFINSESNLNNICYKTEFHNEKIIIKTNKTNLIINL